MLTTINKIILKHDTVFATKQQNNTNGPGLELSTTKDPINKINKRKEKVRLLVIKMGLKPDDH